jgi:hypothetical protein
MRSASHNRSGRFAASFCLLAVLLMHGPLAAAAWNAANMPCCTGSQCSIASHHHSHNSSSKAASSSQAEDCVHEPSDTLKISSCTMSCCHDGERAMVASGLFLLPQIDVFTGTVQIGSAISAAKPAAVSFLIGPPSPPPRASLPVL